MSYCKHTFTLFLCVLQTLGLLAFPAPNQSTVSAQSTEGTIAYVSGISWDEIRLIEADGSNDRLLWTHGLDDPNDGYGFDPGLSNVLSLVWHPDGSELAFASTHERGCSLNTSDIFVVQANGSDLRRVTQAPGCAALAGYPKGTVTIPVENPYGSQFEASIYFQGAPAMQTISIAPNSTSVVTFDNVADLGEGVLQREILVNAASGDEREFGEDTPVDVQAGATVETATLFLDYPNISQRRMQSPTWHSDGSRLGYLFNYTSPYGIDRNSGLLEQGEFLVTAGYLPGHLSFADHLRWGPTPARADQLLYVGEESINKGIYLVEEGSDTMGEQLISVHYTDEDVLDLAWLPDGSGFLYSLLGPAPETSSVAVKSNIYAYHFATGTATRLTDLSGGEFTGRLSISPDGGQIVFERASGWGPNFITGELVNPDLWIMNSDGSDMRLLVEGARVPAWSSQMPTPAPTPTGTQSYLPLLRR